METLETIVAPSLLMGTALLALLAVATRERVPRALHGAAVQAVLALSSLFALVALPASIGAPPSVTGLDVRLADTLAPVSFGAQIDTLSLVMVLLVSTVGLVVYRFSVTYLAGDNRRNRFLRVLLLSIVAVQVLVMSPSLAQIAVSLMAVSLGLHALLTHNKERRRARIAAWTKFLISRLGDAALITAMVIVGSSLGTLNLDELAPIIEARGAELHTPLSLAGFALVIAAMCKSAQFPFHTWLPETLETPTPVSAFMHAGIVNGGGFLLLRVSPILVEASAALTLLVVVGAISAVLGLMVQWTQTEAKRVLAWSTVAQMGFMMVEIGIGAYAAALLHLVGHSYYKAWSFLRTGTLSHVVSPVLRDSAVAARTVLLLVGSVLAAAVFAGALALFGHDVAHMHGSWVFVSLVALAAGHALTLRAIPLPARLVSVVAYASLVSVGVLASEALLEGALLPAPELMERGSLGLVLSVVLPVIFALTMVAGMALPVRFAAGQNLKLYTHLRHGLYIALPLERFVARYLALPGGEQRARAAWLAQHHVKPESGSFTVVTETAPTSEQLTKESAAAAL